MIEKLIRKSFAEERPREIWTAVIDKVFWSAFPQLTPPGDCSNLKPSPGPEAVVHMIQLLVQTLSTGVVAAIVFGLPVIFIGWLLHLRRRRYRAEAHEPFTEMPLRPPGESLRLKIEEKDSQFDEVFANVALIGILAIGMVSMVPAPLKLGTAMGASVVVATVYTWAALRMFKLQKQLWNYRLGFTGERVTGEALNQLLAYGLQVFHDVPFDGFNIDHVIVGSPGVYAVETKTRRKRAELKGAAKAVVYYDGQELKFPLHREKSPIEQARWNAQSLSKWLSQATGEGTLASGIVTIPGWWVECTGSSDVMVMNPKQVVIMFSNGSPSKLSSDQVKRIVYQLTERCRMAKIT
jgi:Nuclease-related domain